MAVYGQMFELYHMHGLPHDELDVMSKYKRLAKIAHDTLYYIRACEVSCRPYDLLGDTTKILASLDEARLLYEETGYHERAVRTLAPLIYINITRGKYTTARTLMQQYESESGLFDRNGIIARGFEMYYYSKGLLHIRCDSLEKAETEMRKLLSAGYEINAYRGLLDIYRRRHQIDSLHKYSLLFEAANDSVALSKQTLVIHQTSALYNYQKHRLTAEHAIAQARKTRLTMWILSVLISSFFVILLLLYRRQENRKRESYKNLLNELNTAKRSLRIIEDDYELIKQSKEIFTERKKAEIQQLQNVIINHEQRWGALSYDNKRTALQESTLVSRFRKYSRGNKKVSPPTVADWKELTDTVTQGLPAINAIMCEMGAELTHREQHVFILHILKFSTKEIAALMEFTPQRVSNIKAQINLKLFGNKIASQLDENIKRAVFRIV